MAEGADESVSKDIKKDGAPPSVLPFEINNENYFLLIGIICTIFDNFLRSSVG